jgi:UDP-N-acetylglucosamine acyltransferase
MTTPEAIHSSAVVDPGARLGAGVRVGAYSVIGPEVTLGDEVEVGHHVVLEGAVEIGARARVGHGAIVGGPPQDLKYVPGTVSGVRIGAGTVIREYATVHRSTRPGGWTEIGRDCLIMAYAHVAHDCRVEDAVIVINYAGITGHCEIGERATIGGYVGIIPFTRVGAYAYVGGCAKVTRDIPPFLLADGNPAVARGVNVVGLRRAGMRAEERRVLQEAYRLLYRSGLGRERALERMRAELASTPALVRLIDFVAGTRRGICGAPGRGVGDEAPAESEVG